VIPFFQFPAEIRRVIYTTNAVESLHMSLRKIIKTRGSFPSEEAALKLLYLALRNVGHAPALEAGDEPLSNAVGRTDPGGAQSLGMA